MSSLNLARFDLLSIKLALDCAHSGRLTAAAEKSNIALAAASRRLLVATANDRPEPAVAAVVEFLLKPDDAQARSSQNEKTKNRKRQ